MRLVVLLLFFVVLISGCKLKSTSITQESVCNCSSESNNVSKSLPPVEVYTFSNNNKISICGEKEGDYFSEFIIKKCNTNQHIEEFSDGTESFRIIFESDTLKIILIKNLPVGDNWQMKMVPIYCEYLTINKNELTDLKTKIIFEKPKIDEKVQMDFIDYIYLNKNNGLQHDWAWEEIISQLEVLTLLGNKRAEKTLKELESITQYKFDGGILEHYKESLATIELLSN